MWKQLYLVTLGIMMDVFLLMGITDLFKISNNTGSLYIMIITLPIIIYLNILYHKKEKGYYCDRYLNKKENNE